MNTVVPPPVTSNAIRNVRWATFEALLMDRGDEGPRLFYDGGTLEIMSPHWKHERFKKILARFIEAFTEELGVEVSSGGSTTLKDRLREKGAEPDESYYVQHHAIVQEKEEIDLAVDPPPDLVLEVDVTSSSIDKLKIYAAFRVPEVWSYDSSGLVVRTLEESGQYRVARESKVLPRFPVAEIGRFLEERKALGETRLVKEFRAWVRGAITLG